MSVFLLVCSILLSAVIFLCKALGYFSPVTLGCHTSTHGFVTGKQLDLFMPSFIDLSLNYKFLR